MRKVIEVRVGPAGEEVVVEAHGMKGPACKKDTAFLEEALGGKQSVTKKAEWWLENSSAIRQQRKFGYDPGKLCG